MESLTENRKNGFVNKILAKFKGSNDESSLKMIKNHFEVYAKYWKILKEKGPAGFPNRLEYQKFAVAKLFIDKIDLMEFSLDPSLKGYKEYKDKSLPPLDAFNMTPDMKETKKIKFCRNFEKGDVLHLRVVEETENEYKLLVINKYDENERVVDYTIYAYMVKSYLLDKLPRPMQINDLVRAAVLGKLKMEENVFSKLLVTLNDNWVNEKYKNMELGLVLNSQIPYYPEDISHHSSFLNYMKADKNYHDPQELIKCMTSLGIDPYKVYSFHESTDGKKLGTPKEIDRSEFELEMKEKSMNLVKEAEKQLLQGMDTRSVLSLPEEALKFYPWNDAAYAVRGQLWKRLFVMENDPKFINNALEDCEEALKLNPYNLIATRVYLTILLLSAEMYKEEKDTAKAKEIQDILDRCKAICDVTEMLTKPDEKE